MNDKMKQFFPLLRSREEVKKEIEQNERLATLFYCWPQAIQDEFLDFCSGARGIKMTYDFMSKEILNPDTHRSRVNEFLSLLLGQKVEVLEVLSNEGGSVASGSLVIMDIVVELEDGSIVNLEIQKIGYLFPGERSACYSADLLLRQYRRIREQYEKRKEKSKNYYKDIKDVYTIVLFEHSPKAFKRHEETYIHRFEQQSDSGVEINLLQKYIFIALDKFKDMKHNDGSKMIQLENRMEAWLAFLSMDDPEDIVAIIEQYPDFQDMYEQVYEICQDMEDVMGFFSKELYEMDRNTAEYMVDEMKRELEMSKKDNEKLERELEEMRKAYEALKNKR